MKRNASPTSPAPATPATAVPKVSSDALFGAHREVRIVHRGQLYTLRVTRLGRLILTK